MIWLWRRAFVGDRSLQLGDEESREEEEIGGAAKKGCMNEQ